MISEDYVSFETAKLLKEKGFRAVTNRYYNAQYDQVRTVSDTFAMDWNDEEYMRSITMPGAVAIPTLQMAMKWLREKYDVFIDISSRFSKNADKDICFSYSCKKLIDKYKSSYEIGDGEWLNYEDTCEAAIKYCLENLI